MKKDTIITTILVVIIFLLLTACEIKDKVLDSNLSRSESNDNNETHENSNNDEVNKPIIDTEFKLINEKGDTIESRINPPIGYKRVKVENNSFGEYLRNLPLKPHGSKVLYFNGQEKYNDVHVAVVDMDIGDRDLQQCDGRK